jgi:hypothetical protein
MEHNFAPAMLSRVAYGFYHPTRLAELQVSITDPLVEIVEKHKSDPWGMARPVLTEAAKNLDASFSAGERGRLDLANPRQALLDAAEAVRKAYSHLDKAFERIDAASRKELAAGGPGQTGGDEDRARESSGRRRQRGRLDGDWGSARAR